mgnify:CR=1 FL=1
MKFNKQINNGTLLIPGGAFKISGFEGGEKVEIHTLDSAVVVLKKQMTTMELIQAMDALHRLATELTVHLARVCGTCDDCEDGCPFDDLEDGMLELPDYLIHKPDTSPEVLAEADLCIQDVLNGTARENHSAYPTVVRNHNGTPFLPDQLLERYLTGLPLKGFPCELSLIHI